MAENSLCSECSTTATHICMCSLPLKLYFCEICGAKHVFKGDAGHGIIRIQAEMLVSSAQDIDAYNSSIAITSQFNTSLDSLTRQAQSEKQELQALAGKIYEERRAALDQVYTDLLQELQARYDQILQDLFTIKSEVNSSKYRLESALSPITVMFIESYVHIQPHVLIDCAAEFEARISLAVLPHESTRTPMQEILSKWHCRKCEDCVKMKEKFTMQKAVSDVSLLIPNQQEPRSRHAHSENRDNASSAGGNCSQCNQSLSLTAYSCFCGKVLNYSV